MKYTIKNDYIEASIDSFGAQLTSLKKVSTNLEYIWCADGKYWGRSSPILFPIVGKLIDDEYIYNNKTYKMSQHGFARDKEFEVVNQTDSFIKFKLSSDEKSLEIYPFEFELYLSYELVNSSLNVYYEVKNSSAEVMYFSIGAHPAFNWPLENENKEDGYLEFNVDKSSRYYLEDGLLSNFQEININRIDLNEKIFEKDAFIFNDSNINQIIYKNSKNDKFIKMTFNDFPYLGIWSKPIGAPFLCIEPWFGVADTLKHNKKFEDKLGLIKLDKDSVFNSCYNIEI